MIRNIQRNIIITTSIRSGILSIHPSHSYIPNISRLPYYYYHNYHHNNITNSIRFYSSESKKIDNEVDKKKEEAESYSNSNEKPKSNDNIDSTNPSNSFFVPNQSVLRYSDLMGTTRPSSLKKQVAQAITYRKPKPSEDGDEVEQYDGPTAIVAVKEGQSPWDQMKARLQDSPLIREILKNTKKLGKVAADTEVGKKAKEINDHIKDKIEDIREIWETSQNPIIYTLSGIWENITGESEEAIATTAIKKLDPNFVKEIWAEEVRTQLAAPVIKAHLTGSIRKWKEWLGEAVYEKLSADIRARKADGYTFDPNILNIDDNMIVTRILDNGTPIIVVVYMVQQINCIRNKQGDIIEGGESDLRVKFYSLAFQQDYNDDKGEVMWKIVDYEFAGDVPYVF